MRPLNVKNCCRGCLKDFSASASDLNDPKNVDLKEYIITCFKFKVYSLNKQKFSLQLFLNSIS